MTGLFTFFSLSTYYLQQTHNYSMSEYSALFALQGIIYTAGSLSRNFLFSKIKTPKLIILSLFGLTFLSLLLCFHPLIPGRPILLFLLCSYLMAFLYGLILGPSTGLLLAPFKKRAGTSAAISGCLQFSIAPVMASLFVIPPIESGLNYGLPLLLLSCLSLYKIGSQEIRLNLKEKM
jgi:DHA1 family bicyclomycin/chloramphenicol resistance-like MFS transporter